MVSAKQRGMPNHRSARWNVLMFTGWYFAKGPSAFSQGPLFHNALVRVKPVGAILIYQSVFPG